MSAMTCTPLAREPMLPNWHVTVEPQESLRSRPGVAAAKRVRGQGPVPIKIDGHRPVNLDVTLDARFNDEASRYELRSLQVDSHENAMDITSQHLRELPTLRLLQSILPPAVTVSTNLLTADQARAIPGQRPTEPMPRPRGGPSQDELDQARTIFEIATMIRLQPARTVARVLRLHQPTTNNWLKIARHDKPLIET